MARLQVVVPVWNGDSSIDRVLSALRDQTIDVDIVVADEDQVVDSSDD